MSAACWAGLGIWFALGWRGFTTLARRLQHRGLTR
jgi:hypothetical protein